jgi:hypothetical protein
MGGFWRLPIVPARVSRMLIPGRLGTAGRRVSFARVISSGVLPLKGEEFRIVLSRDYSQISPGFKASPAVPINVGRFSVQLV